MSKVKASPQSVTVNVAAATVVVDFAKFTVGRTVAANEPPIDEYYRDAIALVRESDASDCASETRKLLVVQLVACVERYVRSLVVRLVGICPCCQSTVQRKQVSLAAVAYYPHADLAHGVLDHQALSGGSEVVRATQQMLGLEVKHGSSAFVALNEFDRVCQLRHAIVHQAGRLGPNNLLEIGIRAPHPVDVVIDALGFQELVMICHSAVRAYNQAIFEAIVERWTREGHLSANWDRDQELFKRLLSLMVSAIDRPGVAAEDEYLKMW